MLAVATLKLRYRDEHVRVVPAVDLAGCPFGGPGVDLHGEAAREAFDAARPLVAWLEAREPVTLRALALDLKKRRVLVSLEEPGKPRVLKIDEASDPASVAELLALAEPLLRVVAKHAAERLSARVGA
jgi:hypothetical protein